MMNQQRMIKLVRLMSVARWVSKVSLMLEEKFGRPEATCNWGQTLTIRYLVSLSNHRKFGQPLNNTRQAFSLIKM